MKPDVKRILTKLAKKQEKSIEVNLEKVELAKKPEAVLKKLQGINAKYEKAQEVMEKAFQDYRRKSKDYREKIQAITDSASDSDDDLSLIEEAIIDLGIKPSAIKPFAQAKNLVEFIQKQGKKLKGRFPDIG